MHVRSRMTTKVITVNQETRCDRALEIMHEANIRRLPVMDGDKLVGIVSERDLRFLVGEYNSNYEKCADGTSRADSEVRTIMQKEPLTIDVDSTIEDAAKLMYIYRVGALPVMRNGKLAGIITASDIFKIFIQILGVSEDSPRLTIELDDSPGKLQVVTEIASRFRANIVSLVTFPDIHRSKRTVVFRLETDKLDEIISALNQRGIRVLD